MRNLYQISKPTAMTQCSPTRGRFLKWHAETLAEGKCLISGKEYCDPDVVILSRGRLQLRKQSLETANIDTFCYLIIGSVFIGVYTSKYI